MTKSDLKNRMVVEVRNGKRYLVVGEMLMRGASFLLLPDYDEDLMHNGDKDFDIVKVFDYVSNFNNIKRCNDVVWQRQEPKKLTLKELEGILGYPVEIVKEMTVKEKREKLTNHCEKCGNCNVFKKNECPLLATDYICGDTFVQMDNKEIEECYQIVFGAESEE